MAEIFRDAFAGAAGTLLESHTSDSGHNWTRLTTETAALNGSGRLRANVQSATAAGYRLGPSAGNDSWQVQLDGVDAGSESSFVAVMVKANWNTYSAYYVRRASGNGLYVEDYRWGVLNNTPFGASSGYAPRGDGTWTIRVESTTAQLRFYWNGILFHTINNPYHTARQFGLAIQVSTTPGNSVGVQVDQLWVNEGAVYNTSLSGSGGMTKQVATGTSTAGVPAAIAVGSIAVGKPVPSGQVVAQDYAVGVTGVTTWPGLGVTGDLSAGLPRVTSGGNVPVDPITARANLVVATPGVDVTGTVGMSRLVSSSEMATVAPVSGMTGSAEIKKIVGTGAFEPQERRCVSLEGWIDVTRVLAAGTLSTLWDPLRAGEHLRVTGLFGIGLEIEGRTLGMSQKGEVQTQVEVEGRIVVEGNLEGSVIGLDLDTR